MRKNAADFDPIAMLPALCLIPLFAALRLLVGWQLAPSWLSGCTPMAAIALCAGIYLPGRWRLAIPLGILLVSDVLLDWHYGADFWTAGMLNRYLLLGLIGAGGMWMRSRGGGAKAGAVLGWTALSSLGFYLGSNALAWRELPGYAGNLAGLIQAWTTGLPGYPPSYVFFRNALVSDLLYSIVFIACVSRARAAGDVLDANGAVASAAVR
jgi:hypothetical protein